MENKIMVLYPGNGIIFIFIFSFSFTFNSIIRFIDLTSKFQTLHILDRQLIN